MARSSYIYLVETEGPARAFTVKHEARTWVRQTRPRSLTVTRIPDGLYNANAALPNVTMDPAEFTD